MKPTIEQENIIQAAVEGSNLAITAFAGAAKTSSCVMIAEAVRKSSLYIAFNKDIAEEASGKFPPHVKCQTVHSLAYKAIIKYPGSALGKRLKPYLQMNDLKKLDLWEKYFGDCDSPQKYSMIIKEAIVAFCQSADDSILHFLVDYMETTGESEDICSNLGAVGLSYWDNLTRVNSDFTISHDIYLKMFQLTKPILTNPESYDLPYEIIFLDESQDSNPVTLDIFLNQSGQKIMVGDPYQAIYEWRGAVNAFDAVPAGFKRLSLTESFRYTQNIANMAKNIIGWLGDEVVITGRGNPTKYRTDSQEHAILCRTNVAIVGYLLDAAEAGIYVYTNINLKELFPKVYYVAALMFGKEPKYPVDFLRQFRSYKELKDAAEKSNELSQLINITSALNRGNKLFENIRLINKYVEPNKELASYSVISGHRSKGLEFDSVKLAWDFCPKIGEEGFSAWVKDNVQEVNLIYVAITRARYKVELPSDLEDLIYDY